MSTTSFPIMNTTTIVDDDSRSCAEFIPSPTGYDPIPYRVHSSAWPVRYALTDGGEDALRALAGEL